VEFVGEFIAYLNRCPSHTIDFCCLIHSSTYYHNTSSSINLWLP
jgi:hypothetical protein